MVVSFNVFRTNLYLRLFSIKKMDLFIVFSQKRSFFFGSLFGSWIEDGSPVAVSLASHNQNIRQEIGQQVAEQVDSVSECQSEERKDGND